MITLILLFLIMAAIVGGAFFIGFLIDLFCLGEGLLFGLSGVGLFVVVLVLLLLL